MCHPCPKKGCSTSCNSEAQLAEHINKHGKKGGKLCLKVCRSWSTTGKCKFGTKCHFSHPDETSEKVCTQTCMVSKCNKKHQCECGKSMVSKCIPSPEPFFNKGCEETVCLCGVREKCPRWHCNDLKCNKRLAEKEGFIRCDGPNGESWKMPAPVCDFKTILNCNLCQSCKGWTVLKAGGPDQTTSCPLGDNMCVHGVSKGTLHCTNTGCGWVDAEPVDQTIEELETKHDEETSDKTSNKTAEEMKAKHDEKPAIQPAIQPADSWEGKGIKETRFFEQPSSKKKSSPKKSLKKKFSSEKPLKIPGIKCSKCETRVNSEKQLAIHYAAKHSSK